MDTGTILLMRHAEKPADAADIHLSPAGAERAEELASYVPQRFGKPDFLFAAAASKHSDRPVSHPRDPDVFNLILQFGYEAGKLTVCRIREPF